MDDLEQSRPGRRRLRSAAHVADTALTAVGAAQLVGRAVSAVIRSRARPEKWELVVEERHAVGLYARAAARAAQTTGRLGYEALRDGLKDRDRLPPGR